MKCILVNPPLLDPTLPPHSFAYLIGAAKHKGFHDIEFFDLNIYALNFLFSHNHISTLLSYRDSIIKTSLPNTISTIDALRYRICASSINLTLNDILSSRDTFFNPDNFFDIKLYRLAYNILNCYIDLCTAPHFPYAFSLSSDWFSRYGSFDIVNNLTSSKFLSIYKSPLQAPFEYFITNICRSVPKLIGISTNYTSQLPFTLALLSDLRATLPNSTFVIGGTEISNILKKIKNKALLKEVFGDKVLLVVGEGESAFIELLTQIDSDFSEINHPNIVLPGSDSNIVHRIENINKIGLPDFSIFKWPDYWSPEPVAMISPTRGCYWNKCTFCDYGLNFDLPTSPSRQLSLDMLQAKLREVSKFASVIYLAVDAISPSYLRRMASLIESENLEISWSTEIRLERNLMHADSINMLRRAGCVSLSFGYESGSPRILSLIDKGVDLSQVHELLRSIKAVGINIQMMGFTGFPSETRDEAMQTYSFLRDHQSEWFIAAIGDFSLTPGAIVAKTPSVFQIGDLRFPSTDIQRTLQWSNSDFLPERGDRFSDLRSDIDFVMNPFGMGRPFLGGIDTAHSILYFRHYTRDQLDTIINGAACETDICKIHVPISNLNDFPTVDIFPTDGIPRTVCDVLSYLDHPVSIANCWTEYFLSNRKDIYKVVGIPLIDHIVLERISQRTHPSAH